jgi:hypothetical protein
MDTTAIPQAMNFVLVPATEWERIINVLTTVEARLKPKDEWIDTAEACSILGITPHTFTLWRKKYNIQYSQAGRKVLVKRSEIERLLKRKSVKP